MKENDENIELNNNSFDETSVIEKTITPDIKVTEKSQPELQTHSEIINKKKKKNKKPIFIILIIILLAGAGGAAWYFYFYNKPTVINQQDNTIIETDPQSIKMATPTTGEIWLDKPIAIEKQGYFVTSNLYNLETEAKYFKVGNKGDISIIMVSYYGDFQSEQALFEKSANGDVSYIIYPSSTAIYNKSLDDYVAAALRTGVKINKEVRYDSLSIPDRISINDKGDVVMAPTYPTIGSVYVSPDSYGDKDTKHTVVKQLGNASLMKSESANVLTNLNTVSYFIKTGINTRIDMRYEPLDANLANYQWSTGVNYIGSDSLRSMTYGCGGNNTFLVTISSVIKESDVEQVGKSSKGLIVYGLKDVNNALMQKAYDEFKTGSANGMIGYKGDISSVNEFMEQHAVVIFKDLSGEWLVYTRNEMAPEGACAKPVVYLYPTEAQNINVRVGADVKISDPLYNSNTGWNAFARPNGQLTVSGTKYGSLFWEGPGYGQYPEITSGTIVKKADAVNTIRQQLIQQGLNTTEIKDFIDYWQNKVPNKPYVRLTWFNTGQMNQLAPLYVSPKPDTIIRVFLDMSGLDNPIDIPAQNLTSISRSGFTVVEWGGLSTKKLW